MSRSIFYVKGLPNSPLPVETMVGLYPTIES